MSSKFPPRNSLQASGVNCMSQSLPFAPRGCGSSFAIQCFRAMSVTFLPRVGSVLGETEMKGLHQPIRQPPDRLGQTSTIHCGEALPPPKPETRVSHEEYRLYLKTFCELGWEVDQGQLKMAQSFATIFKLPCL